MKTEQRSRTVRPVRRPTVLLACVAATGGLLVAGSGAAHAADIGIDAPAESTVGEVVTVTATITDGGEAVADAVVAVTRQAVLAGESGFATLDTGVTDADGVVQLEFVQLAAATDAATFRVELLGEDGTESAEFELAVVDGPQQFRSTSGADIGFINVSWLVVVLALVWAFLLIAAWQFVRISRARPGAKRVHHALPYYMVGFVAFTAAGMFYVVLTQPTMHANLDPNTPFDRVPTAYVGQEYEYRGLGSGVENRPTDLSGEALFVQTGCASCHGIGGRGAVVGGELSDSTMNDLEEVEEAVRRGPAGMPVYSDASLSAAELDRIIEFVVAANDG